MDDKSLKKIIKGVLITGIILWGLAHILPMGEVSIENEWKIEFFHWGLWRTTTAYEQRIDFMPTANLSEIPGSPEFYSFAFSTLLVYLILLVSVSCLVAGIMAIARLDQKPSKHSLYAGILCIGTLLLFIISNQLLGPGFAGVLSRLFRLSLGFYLMTASAVLFLLAYVLIKKSAKGGKTAQKT
jgi:hypothetical protein